METYLQPAKKGPNSLTRVDSLPVTNALGFSISQRLRLRAMYHYGGQAPNRAALQVSSIPVV